MLSIILLLFNIAGAVFGLDYRLVDSYTPGNFFSKFDFFIGPDPTNGFVTYVDYSTAVSSGLIPDPAVAKWGVDHTNTISPAGPGRRSVRITSKARYTHGLFVADIAHMPSSTCGLWPAFWMLGQTGTWPQSGELDMLEGVHAQRGNLISAHTKDGCVMDPAPNQTATPLGRNCAVPFSTTGCGNADARPSSYGTSFNANPGGVYAVDWTSRAIRVWFWLRDQIPASMTRGAPDPDADFGRPTAVFQGECDIDAQFYDMSFVFDTTFCGDWAGNTFEAAGCPMASGQASWPSCVTYVAGNPREYAEAYWDVRSIGVYKSDGAEAVPRPQVRLGSGEQGVNGAAV